MLVFVRESYYCRKCTVKLRGDGKHRFISKSSVTQGAITLILMQLQSIEHCIRKKGVYVCVGGRTMS